MKPLSLAIAMCGVFACGSEDPPPGPPVYGPCEARPASGGVARVDLNVSYPVPTGLSTGCPGGDPDRLGAFLLIPPAESCVLDASVSGISGCCPSIAADRTVDITAVYEVAASRTRLAEHVKRIDLPTTSAPVVDLTFADAPPIDGSIFQMGQNLSDFCAGLL